MGCELAYRPAADGDGMERALTTITSIGVAASIAWATFYGLPVDASPAEAAYPAASTETAAAPALPATPEEEPVTTSVRRSEPQSGIQDGSVAERAIVEKALERMDDAGLVLPPVLVVIHDAKTGCDGNNGIFRSNGTDYRVDICHVSDFVITHELSHVWEHHNVTDEGRTAFVEAAGLDSWNDADVKWVDRGIERSANTVAKVLLSDGEACGELGTLYEALASTPCPGANS